jgi:GH43 family beta-xylosidase
VAGVGHLARKWHWMALPLLLALLLSSLLLLANRHARATPTIVNPIVAQGQDPSVVRWHDAYYLAQSDGAALTITRATTLQGLGRATPTPIYGPICCDVWAPELIGLGGRWYIYYSAAPHGNASHRMYVLQSVGPDPSGPYRELGKIAAATDRWAIDGTVLQLGRAIYFIWSGWPGFQDGEQNLYIARMRTPWSIAGDRALLSEPTAHWERTRTLPTFGIEEGPEVLQHTGRLFLVYSANGSWTNQYCLGMLTYEGGDVMRASAWRKSNGCVFAEDPAAGVYGPGHNSFTTSPDGTQSWLLYHANLLSGMGWAGRSIRAQRFTWRADGTPDFGVPVAAGVPLAVPSGEP